MTEKENTTQSQIVESPKKPVGKVFINMRKAVFDYNEKSQTKLKKQDLVNFVIEKGAPKSRWTSFIRKTKEDSGYELTITEVYNLTLYLDISIGEFITKYCKAL